jgi:hypothetical protein
MINREPQYKLQAQGAWLKEKIISADFTDVAEYKKTIDKRRQRSWDQICVQLSSEQKLSCPNPDKPE